MQTENNAEMHEASDQPPFKPYSFNSLLLVKSAQNQNGLRHNDYYRYHQYCVRKIYRLRKVLKFVQQGGNKAK